MKLDAIVLFSCGSDLLSCSNIAWSVIPLPMLVLVVSFLLGKSPFHFIFRHGQWDQPSHKTLVPSLPQICVVILEDD